MYEGIKTSHILTNGSDFQEKVKCLISLGSKGSKSCYKNQP